MVDLKTGDRTDPSRGRTRADRSASFLAWTALFFGVFALLFGVLQPRSTVGATAPPRATPR